jgi:hypothetical protein
MVLRFWFFSVVHKRTLIGEQAKTRKESKEKRQNKGIKR